MKANRHNPLLGSLCYRSYRSHKSYGIPSRHFEVIENSLQQVLRRDVFRLRFIRHYDAMAEDIVADRLQNPNELLVQIPIMQGAALGLAVREQLRHVWIWTVHPLHTSVEGRFVN